MEVGDESRRELGDVPGERNRVWYEGRGPAVVIAPWNFPLAILSGMTAAALVTGNCVVYKPSSLTPVTGRRLADIYREAGIPPGVFNYLIRNLQGMTNLMLYFSDTYERPLTTAVGTAKRHLNNIYGKLGVGSRTQAVAYAREIGLA